VEDNAGDDGPLAKAHRQKGGGRASIRGEQTAKKALGRGLRSIAAEHTTIALKRDEDGPRRNSRPTEPREVQSNCPPPPPQARGKHRTAMLTRTIRHEDERHVDRKAMIAPHPNGDSGQIARGPPQEAAARICCAGPTR